MIGLSQSQFLHALGWATLNSLWQMALLWCIYVAAKSLFNLSASLKYKLSVTAIITGFLWSISTFVIYFNSSESYHISIFQQALSYQSYMPIVLTTASITYLLLLLVPAYRLFINWRYTQVLRKSGLQKIDIQYRLFVKKISWQVGISKNVAVYISDLIKSPVTIGFLKPMILLPIASINNLTVQQVEAVLLHELSHIRRFDYIVNLLLNITHTFLYFNPFIKLFLRIAVEERENCCDEMVLQFGYDKVSYASALLTLEKASNQAHILAICAAGRKNLLARIEKIVGVKRKPVLSFNHLAGIVAALLCILALNSLLITSKEGTPPLSFNNPVNPFYFFSEETISNKPKNAPYTKSALPQKSNHIIKKAPDESTIEVPLYPSSPEPEKPEYLQVTFDEVDATLGQNEKNTVKETVENTKKVLATYEWNEIENSIGDVLTLEEKQRAKQDYLKEIANIDWENFEKKLKVEYEKINWEKVNLELNTALTLAKLDSIIAVYEGFYQLLGTADLKVRSFKDNQVSSSIMPMPDESIKYIDEKKKQLKLSLDTLKDLRKLDVIKL